jgi:serine/threonine protein kinase
VIGTENPLEAIDLIQQHDPFLVLLDVNMPGLDGLTLLGRIREAFTCPVVMLTGINDAETAVRALRMGAYDYLTKPVQARKLLDIVSIIQGTVHDPNDSRRIGRYHLRRELGRGGMGVVYEAHDPTLDRLVALKVLSPSLAADNEFEHQFLREARAAARVSHPGLVAIYEAGRDRGKLYMAMELVEGMTLTALQRSACRISPVEAMDIVAQAADALGAAHASGIVHRDIKPNNIMLTSRLGVKVLDFGLVHHVMEKDGSIPLNGYAVGTPGYASPEALRGQTVDPRSDIYSLGVVLYELLAGERPSDKSVLTGVPGEVVLLIDRMMSPNLSGRPSSMHEVATALRRIRSFVKRALAVC